MINVERDFSAQRSAAPSRDDTVDRMDHLARDDGIVIPFRVQERDKPHASVNIHTQRVPESERARAREREREN